MANGLRRSANVSQSITQRMQIRRVTDHDQKFAMFGTRDEAERWLDREAAAETDMQVAASR